MPLVIGTVAQFPSATCGACPLRTQCTIAKQGRSIAVHPEEEFLADLRARQQTPAGRAILRQRTVVEHRLAAVESSQGHNARYMGERKNLYDLRRHAAVANLHVAAAPTRAAA